MKSNIRPLRSILLLFIVLTVFFYFAKNMLEENGVDHLVLIAGNTILVAVTVLAYLVSARSFPSTNPNASVRALYGSFMIKFFLIAIAAFAYIIAARKNVNKPALIICMGLYMIYTFIEVSVLTKSLRKKENA
jgi:hypothetical protein